MPPGRAPFNAGQLARHSLVVLVAAGMGDARSQRAQVAPPKFDRQHPPDCATVDQLLGLMGSRLPRGRPVDDQFNAGGPRSPGHLQTVLQRGSHRFFDYDMHAMLGAGLHHGWMLRVFRATDDDIDFLLLQHLVVVVIRLWNPQVVQCMAKIPGACIVGRAQFRDQCRRIRAGHKLGLWMGGETLDQMVDVHVGKANHADTIDFRHMCLSREQA